MTGELCPVEWYIPRAVHLALLGLGALFAVIAILVRRTGGGEATVTVGPATVKTSILWFIGIACLALGGLAWMFYVQPAWQRWALQSPLRNWAPPFGESDAAVAVSATDLTVGDIHARIDEKTAVSVAVRDDAKAVAVNGSYGGSCWAALFDDLCKRNAERLTCSFDAGARVLRVCGKGQAGAPAQCS